MAHPHSQNDAVPLSDDTLCACGHLLWTHRAGVVVRGDEIRVVLLCGECAAAGRRRSPLEPRFRQNRCLLPVPA